MSTPAKSFDDLRSILGKLDRKIDRARSKRLGLDDEPESTPTTPDQPIGEPESDNGDAISDQDLGQTALEDARKRSPFGRAKPLNRNGSSQNNWIGGSGIG